MSSDIDILIREVADLKRRLAQTVQVGPVKEVKGSKLKMVIGKDMQGQEVLSPWVDTTNHRGGATERRFFKAGQNVTLISVNGDPSQSMVMPYAPNNTFKDPDHANETGQDEEVYQLEDLRVRKTKDGYETWLGDKDGANATHMVRINKDGGITGRIKTGSKVTRFAAHKDGAKIRAEDGGVAQYLVVTPSQIIASSPLVISADPIPNDDN